MFSIFQRKDAQTLWQAILEMDSELRRLSPMQAQEELRRGGFPRSLVQDYLAKRDRERPRLAVGSMEASSSFSSSSSSG